jgi:hypothetical protein
MAQLGSLCTGGSRGICSAHALAFGIQGALLHVEGALPLSKALQITLHLLRSSLRRGR